MDMTDNTTAVALCEYAGRLEHDHRIAYLLGTAQSQDEPLYLHGTCDPFLQRASVLLFDQNFLNGSITYYNCSTMILSVYLEQPGAISFSENADSFTIIATQSTLATGTFVPDVN
ncbi:unnamed protein product [Adineta ricciae]|uniref:Uncharacterized protein n=1 Tax=Adineta ricciae TaxID=249248 RepID=A0A815VQJ8_ADIRI|nr:unnamed protein product [Adineta ricciae]